MNTLDERCIYLHSGDAHFVSSLHSIKVAWAQNGNAKRETFKADRPSLFHFLQKPPQKPQDCVILDMKEEKSMFYFCFIYCSFQLLKNLGMFEVGFKSKKNPLVPLAQLVIIVAYKNIL